MTKELKGAQVAKNITLSLFAQVISLLVSFILSLIVPKFIDEYQYAYWQTFLLYSSYVGVLHFGLLDGIVLRYSQYDYEELDKKRMRTQFVALLAITSVAFCVLITFGINNGGFTQTIAFFVACSIFTKNIFAYNSFLFQITNRINKYAFVVIVQRIMYGAIVLFLIIFKNQDYVWFCIANLLGDCAGIGLSLVFNRDLHFGSLLSLNEIVKETWLNISSGVLLMIANWSSMFLVGSAKMIVELKWGPLIFGKTSFAFSVTNLVLSFVTAISIVLFPSLKRMRQDMLPSFYQNIRNMLLPLVFWGLILYYPECWVLDKWLPKYSNSLLYLGLLSPLVIYTSIVSLLTNNYLKAFRKERILLIINVLSVFLAVFLYIINAYWFCNFTLMLLSVVLVVMLRSMISEMVVMNLININFKKELIIELCMTCVFLISVLYFNRISGFLLYFILLMIYSIFNFNNIRQIIARVSSLAISHNRFEN